MFNRVNCAVKCDVVLTSELSITKSCIVDCVDCGTSCLRLFESVIIDILDDFHTHTRFSANLRVNSVVVNELEVQLSTLTMELILAAG